MNNKSVIDNIKESIKPENLTKEEKINVIKYRFNLNHGKGKRKKKKK